MFAGLHGLGNSVLKSHLSPKLLAVCLNPDEIHSDMEVSCFWDLSVFGVSASEGEVLGFFRESELLRHERIQSQAERLAYINGRRDFSRVTMNVYFTTVVVDGD